MKYIVGDNPTPLLKDTRKDKLEGHHGSDIKIQVVPTKKYIFSLYRKYLSNIRKPTNKEIITNMKLNIPFKISKRFNAIFSLLPFYV
jgi:RNA binding exosome subunit